MNTTADNHKHICNEVAQTLESELLKTNSFGRTESFIEDCSDANHY